MRLIDADALIADFESVGGEFDVDGIKYIINTYHKPADVVPVVRGEWIVTDAYPHRVYCSLCYKTNVPNEEWLYEKNDYPQYCMWCGAKME